MGRGARLWRASCFWATGCMCTCGARVGSPLLPKWRVGAISRTAKAFGCGGTPRTRCGSNESAELVPAAGAGLDGAVFCGAARDCLRVQFSHAGRLRWRRVSMDFRKLYAAGRSAISRDSVALAVDCGIIDGHLRGARISSGAFCFARGEAEESVSATGAAAVLDELSGAHVCVAVYPARYRADQYGSFSAAHHSQPAAAAL